MNKIAQLFAVTTTLLFMGCSSITEIALTPTNAHELNGASLAYTEREYPTLSVYSVDHARAARAGMLGSELAEAIAGATSEASINRRIKSSSAPNPNDLFRELILKNLEKYNNITRLPSAGIQFDENTHRLNLENSTVESDFIMDSKVEWECSYLPKDPGQHMFQFHFTLTVANPETSESIYRGFFHWETPKELGFPKMDEFITDENRGIEAQIRSACSVAADFFNSQLATK